MVSFQKLNAELFYIDFKSRNWNNFTWKNKIPGEFYRRGEEIRAYLYQVEETPRGSKS